ncbi:uracil-DNA glycosylase [Pseudoduganella ginsengisoli]|uniref:Uracil-DNA glycosylase n=1 Tax=Pseudoduganella ginsengisoli TaxID=1462440 RepID=A0A6L6PX54_9BURK|nr:uracil-DNA glycosylase [Pseudoduganella ginsengisoli]MTW02137.1 uracil-DNA glycosylase [Pseudoduganella ginsengisoli]
MPIPSHLIEALERADASWRPVLAAGLQAMHAATPAYFETLTDFLPTEQRLFAAFAQPMDRVRYVLIGEGPYPRAESATGVCFMDGAVKGLWSEEEGGGLSKAVNKATSLRNFMKMLLVADGRLAPDDTGTLALARIAAQSRGVPGVVQSLGEIQQKFFDAGFLLLNATLVFRETVAPAKDAKAWMPFLQTVLAALNEQQPTLVLWGKIAEQLNKLEEAQALPQIAAEHPYNLSFITNSNMHALFKPMGLLRC